MKNLKCTQCGATINPETLTCEYCGSVFFSSEVVQERERKKAEAKKKEIDAQYIDSNPYDNIKVRNLTDEEIYNLIKTTTNYKPTGYLFPIFFMIMWTVIALFIAINVLRMDSFAPLPFIELVPFVFVIIGISTTINTIKQALQGSMATELNLIKKGLFNEACDSLEKRESKKHNLNFVAAIILLCYFRLGDYEVAKQNIISLPQKELAELLDRSNVYYEVAKELNVRTPEFGGFFTPFQRMIKDQLSRINFSVEDDD